MPFAGKLAVHSLLDTNILKLFQDTKTTIMNTFLFWVLGFIDKIQDVPKFFFGILLAILSYFIADIPTCLAIAIIAGRNIGGAFV